MVSEMQIGMVVELNVATAIKTSDWWLDSGPTIYVCNDKAQDRKYDGSQEVLMGNHSFAIVLGKESVELQFIWANFVSSQLFSFV